MDYKFKFIVCRKHREIIIQCIMRTSLVLPTIVGKPFGVLCLRLYYLIHCAITERVIYALSILAVPLNTGVVFILCFQFIIPPFSSHDCSSTLANRSRNVNSILSHHVAYCLKTIQIVRIILKLYCRNNSNVIVYP